MVMDNRDQNPDPMRRDAPGAHQHRQHVSDGRRINAIEERGDPHKHPDAHMPRRNRRLFEPRENLVGDRGITGCSTQYVQVPSDKLPPELRLLLFNNTA